MTSVVCVLNDGNSNVATLGEYYGQAVRSLRMQSAYRLPLNYRDAPTMAVRLKRCRRGRSLNLELSS
jgi:hypothetical protein